jgi:hypothetical protein
MIASSRVHESPVLPGIQQFTVLVELGPYGVRPVSEGLVTGAAPGSLTRGINPARVVEVRAEDAISGPEESLAARPAT